MVDYSRIQVMADSGRIASLEREWSWAESAAANIALYGPGNKSSEYATAVAKMDAIRARIRAARAYLRSDDYADDIRRSNDWIAS